MPENFSPYKTNFFDVPSGPPADSILAERFLVPPFSVLSAREGSWQSRKRAWLRLGIKSEIGRGGDLVGLARAANYKNRERGSGKPIPGTAAGRTWGQDIMRGENNKFSKSGCRPHYSGSLDERSGREPGTEYEGGDAWVAPVNGSGTSIFDPVLCELMYRWFCPAGGQVIDPFAGGSVRGIVAALLDYKYHGIELREVQVTANKQQAAEICPEKNELSWVCGDSLELLEQAPQADFVFSCPPYGDLEQYSDDPRDLSTMEYHTFVANYKRIILRCVHQMKNNRFACFVVGNYRDQKTGNYRNLVGDTIAAFTDAGCGFYNEAILLTAIGSLPIRVTKQFTSSRKLGRTHQNILVFVKGDGKEAAKEIRGKPD